MHDTNTCCSFIKNLWISDYKEVCDGSIRIRFVEEVKKKKEAPEIQGRRSMGSLVLFGDLLWVRTRETRLDHKSPLNRK